MSIQNITIAMPLDIKISIIIPAYNSATFIEKTLLSVLHQTYTDFEVIIIDDGSTDATSKIIEKWQRKDARIKYYYKPNGGVSSARNLGIEKAKGEFISFLDSDDHWERSFLEKMYSTITSGDYNITWCGFQYKIAGKVQKRSPEKFEIDDIIIFIINGNWISTDSWMIRKSFLQDKGIKFTEGFHYGEDFEFFCKSVLTAGDLSITTVREYLTDYNIRRGSLSERDPLWVSMKYIQGSLDAYKSLYNFIQTQDHNKKIYLFAMANRIKKSYLFWLWGTLLLGKRNDFKILYTEYQKDIPNYQLAIPSNGIKYKIWEVIITTPILRVLGRYVFIPYKYIQRKLKILKLSSK